MIVSYDNEPPMSFEHLYVDTIDEVYDWVDNERLFIVIKFNNDHYYCDALDSYRLRDMSRVEGEGTGSNFKLVAGPFASIVEALDYPFLDGKSVRERFNEVEFLTD